MISMFEKAILFMSLALYMYGSALNIQSLHLVGAGILLGTSLPYLWFSWVEIRENTNKPKDPNNE